MYPELGLFIDGALIVSGGRSETPVINPANNKTLAYLPHATHADLDAALEAAQAAFPKWRDTSAYERARIISRAANLIRERKTAIARTLTLEQGKILAEAEGEVSVSADILDWYAEEGRRAYGRTIPSRAPNIRYLVEPEPVGPCVAFTPWNFPALTPARKIGGALAAGCSLILKPAEETPGTALELMRAFADAGLPNGVLNLVFGDPADISSYLIAAPAIRKVSFTGSTPVGKHLMHLAADGLKLTTMELGGHAPVLVFDDADPVAVGQMAAASKFRNAGQICISPTRFYVQENSYEKFVDSFMNYTNSIKLGDGLEKGVTMGPLANGRRVEAMERLVADARNRGAVIRCGGVRSGNEGFFFEPTVIEGLSDDSAIMTEEPFGPIAPIVPFKSLAEVLDRANSLPFGLAAYAFTSSLSTASAVSKGLRAGMVGINTFAVSNPETPFGGIKESGHGQEGGIEGLQVYLETKFIAQA